MKYIIASSLIIISVTSCMNLAIHGDGTISKSDTEKRLQDILFAKGVSCGLEPGDAYTYSEFINPSSGVVIIGPSKDKTAKNILYEKKAVDHCERSLALFPCPPSNLDKEKRDERFIETAVYNLIAFCTFDTIDFFEFKVLGEGRIF
ncbi:MAG: hypothetical protein JJT78_10405 [Leptospira sp.]|nr:hypothetical protein [Leptospira sp.]